MDIFGNVSRVLNSTDLSPMKKKEYLEDNSAAAETGENAELQEGNGSKKHQVKAKALLASQSHEDKLQAIVGGTSEETERGADEVTLPYKGRNVTLKGVDINDITYTKRPETEQAELRKEFNNKVRKAFVKDLANDEEKQPALEKAGLKEMDFQMMRNGKIPPGFQVHHKMPLDDSGTNDFSNFCLIKNEPAHKALTNLQVSSIEGMTEGDSRNIEWVIPRGFIYPPDPSYVTVSPQS